MFSVESHLSMEKSPGAVLDNNKYCYGAHVKSGQDGCDGEL